MLATENGTLARVCHGFVTGSRRRNPLLEREIERERERVCHCDTKNKIDPYRGP